MWRNHYLRVGPLMLALLRNPQGWPYGFAAKWRGRFIFRLGV